jgi:hypothetical protein
VFWSLCDLRPTLSHVAAPATNQCGITQPSCPSAIEFTSLHLTAHNSKNSVRYAVDRVHSAT